MNDIQRKRDAVVADVAKDVENAKSVQEALSIIFLNDAMSTELLHGASQQLRRAVERFNDASTTQTDKLIVMTRKLILLTWVIAGLTVILGFLTLWSLLSS